MRALCPQCGVHHEVVRVLDDGFGERRKDVYQVAPLATCQVGWLSDQQLLEARAKYDQEAIIEDDDFE